MRHARLLTDVGIKRLKTTPQRQEIWDTGYPGLVLRVTPRGTRTLTVVYKVRDQLTETGRMTLGSQKRITLGDTPPIGLAEARAKANAILEHAKEAGRDPRSYRRAEAALHFDNTFTKVRERL